MPQIKPEYEVVKEYNDLAAALVEKYPEAFPGVDVDRIRCFAVTNKDRKENKPPWDIKAVPMPVLLDCPFAWYIMIFMNDWDEMSQIRRQLLVADSLCAIPEDGEEGKINSKDMKGFSVMLRTFGTDFMEKPEKELKDLLEGSIDWVFTNRGDD